MTSSGLALVDVLAQIPDPRQSSGKRYSLQAILSLAIAAMLCGYKSYSAIAEWGRHYGRHLAEALGFTNGKTPCAATFYNIFSRLDKQAVEQQLGHWAEGLLKQSSVADEGDAVAIDGKTLRGSKKQGTPAAHLLSALGHRLGLTLLQVAVADKTNEIRAIQELLHGLILKDKIITVDALLTQREVAQTITDHGGDYVMVVKEDQPGLLAQVEGTIEGCGFYTQEPQTAASLDGGHGGIEQREILTTSVLADCGVWPGLNQAFRIDRRIIEQKSGKTRSEVVYGITSLSRQRAAAEVVLRINREHWSIENKSHWV